MKQYYILLFLFLLFPNSDMFACSCTTDGPFLQVSTGAELIAVVEIQDYLTYDELMGEDVPMSMSLKIKKVLKGEENRNEIIAWGNNGLMCSPYLSLFEIGTQWVISFKEAPTEGHENAKIDDYGISNCGEHFMKISSGTVTGLISGGNSYQSMSIGSLKKNLDIINREKHKIDFKKCQFIRKLYDLGIDTIGVFENYHINKVIRSLKLRASFQMASDDDYLTFYNYMKDADINRQIFIYWQSKGKTYVKQLDNLFDYDEVEVPHSLFFSNYFQHKQWLIPERLELPNRKKRKLKKRKKQAGKQTKKPIKQKVNLILPAENPIQNAYVIQSTQMFIGGNIFLRDFDIRLFNKFYNPRHFKKNRKTLTHSWLIAMTDEVENIALENEKSYNLFKQYKRELTMK